MVLNLENIRLLLEEKGIEISLHKQHSVLDAIQTNINNINNALEAAGLPDRAILQSVDMIENYISWTFSYVIHNNYFIN